VRGHPAPRARSGGRRERHPGLTDRRREGPPPKQREAAGRTFGQGPSGDGNARREGVRGSVSAARLQRRSSSRPSAGAIVGADFPPGLGAALLGTVPPRASAGKAVGGQDEVRLSSAGRPAPAGPHKRPTNSWRKIRRAVFARSRNTRTKPAQDGGDVGRLGGKPCDARSALAARCRNAAQASGAAAARFGVHGRTTGAFNGHLLERRRPRGRGARGSDVGGDDGGGPAGVAMPAGPDLISSARGAERQGSAGKGPSAGSSVRDRGLAG